MTREGPGNYPPDRTAAERMRIYRVVLSADVAVGFGDEQILNEIGDLFDKLTMEHWDVFNVEITPRDELNGGKHD